jgi:hypothetical protein
VPARQLHAPGHDMPMQDASCVACVFGSQSCEHVEGSSLSDRHMSMQAQSESPLQLCVSGQQKLLMQLRHSPSRGSNAQTPPVVPSSEVVSEEVVSEVVSSAVVLNDSDPLDASPSALLGSDPGEFAFVASVESAPEARWSSPSEIV